jgi:competence protein ComEC
MGKVRAIGKVRASGDDGGASPWTMLAMPGTQAPREGGTALIAPVLGASVAGAALQLQQPTLWPVAVYVVFTVAGLALLALSASRRLASPWPVLLALTGALLAGGGACGWRAQAFASQALAPALEGRDLRVTGVVAAMPQRNETGLRFRLAVESAWLGAQEVRLPPRLQLGWYGGAGAGELTRQPADLRAGERWQMTVRLKAPHGHLNPHGFDYELWLWEQGVQATGYVRAGPRDGAAATPGHDLAAPGGAGSPGGARRHPGAGGRPPARRHRGGAGHGRPERD